MKTSRIAPSARNKLEVGGILGLIILVLDVYAIVKTAAAHPRVRRFSRAHPVAAVLAMILCALLGPKWR